MYERVLAIEEKALGKDNPSTAATLCGLADVLKRNVDDDLIPTVTLTPNPSSNNPFSDATPNPNTPLHLTPLP